MIVCNAGYDKIYLIKGGDFIINDDTVIKKKDFKTVVFKYAGLFSDGYIKFNREGKNIYFKRKHEDQLSSMSQILELNGVYVEYI